MTVTESQMNAMSVESLIFTSLIGAAINIIVGTVSSGIKDIVGYIFKNYVKISDFICDLIWGKRNKIVIEYLIDESTMYQITFDIFVMNEMYISATCKEAKMLRKNSELFMCPTSNILFEDVNYCVDFRVEENGKKRSTYRSLIVWSRKKSLTEIKEILKVLNNKYVNVITNNAIMIANEKDGYYVLNDLFTVNFTKSLDDVYDENIKHKVKHALDAYKKESPETRKLKIMLYGPPGTGKTTLITSIAKETDGVLIMTKISKFRTIDELRKFMFKTSYDSADSDKSRFCIVQPNTKIIVFEDVDADIGEIIKIRSDIDTTKKQKTDNLEKVVDALKAVSDKTDGTEKITKKDEINLSDLLNLFDGILQLQNIIVVFTTNCLDKIDPAFYRPGRMDICERMGALKHGEVMNYIKRIYGKDYSKDFAKGFAENSLDDKIKISELSSMTYATDSFKEFKQALGKRVL